MAENEKEMTEQKLSRKDKKAEKEKARAIKKAEKKSKKENQKEITNHEEVSVSVSYKKTRTGFIKLLQHLLITAFSVCLFTVIIGSFVIVPGVEEESTYFVSPTDENREYEDSVLFNTILGNNLFDLFRYVTIQTQVETDGRYDPDKVINVIEYNSRNNSENDFSLDSDVNYYLADLLKWEKSGFSYKSISYDKLSATEKKLAANDYDGDPLIYFADDEEKIDYIYQILDNRYTTVDGRNIEEYVTNWEQYNELANQIMLAASDLSSNYSEYLNYKDYFDDTSTNIKYCVVNKGNNNNKLIYSNLELKDTSINSIREKFKKYGKYIIYDFNDMTYSTNTAISENVFYGMMNDYKYAFSDEGLIFIGVDTKLTAQDALAKGKTGYNKFLPYFSEMICIMIVCAVLYLVLLVLCTIKEGRVRNTDGTITIRQTPFDNTSIELWIFLSFLAIFVPISIFAAVYQYFSSNVAIFSELYFKVGVALFVFIVDVLILNLYYSLIRRIKGHNIWKPSILNKILEAIEKFVYSLIDNKSATVRSVFPYTLLVLLNGFIGLFAIGDSSNIPICFLLIMVIDIAAGVIIFRQAVERKKLIDGLSTIVAGNFAYKAPDAKLHGDNIELSTQVNAIGNSIRIAVEQSMKDEKMKTELVANVSHDIRTPLTSIINYVDLLKRENIPNENIQNYIKVLDEKSQRLKSLTDDLIEASKVSSGNIEINLEAMELPELINQAFGEFEDKFNEKNLSCVFRNEQLYNGTVKADGKSLWRVMENLLGNIYKYAMPDSRVFIDMFNVCKPEGNYAVVQIKNMSAAPLPDNNLSDLTDRFIRGDQARSSEGSGLGLSIAKSLTELMGGTFEIGAEADLFKVELVFPNV